VRNQYVTVDGHDVWAYVMPRELKLRLGLDLARSLRELEHAEVVHRDIKPSNMLLHVGDAELKEGLLLKLMDFGEAAAADVCTSRAYCAHGRIRCHCAAVALVASHLCIWRTVPLLYNIKPHLRAYAQGTRLRAHLATWRSRLSRRAPRMRSPMCSQRG
jgi:serine/threonine protein kinase